MIENMDSITFREVTKNSRASKGKYNGIKNKLYVVARKRTTPGGNSSSVFLLTPALMDAMGNPSMVTILRAENGLMGIRVCLNESNPNHFKIGLGGNTADRSRTMGRVTCVSLLESLKHINDLDVFSVQLNGDGIAVFDTNRPLSLRMLNGRG